MWSQAFWAMCFILLRRAGAAARQGGGEARANRSRCVSGVRHPSICCSTGHTRRRTERAPRAKAKGARGKGWWRGGDRRGRSVRRISSRRGSHLPPPLQEPPPRPWRPGDESRERHRASLGELCASFTSLVFWQKRGRSARLASLPPGRGTRCFEQGSARDCLCGAHTKLGSPRSLHHLYPIRQPIGRRDFPVEMPM